jgi:predicted nucleotidyltransferase
MEPPIEMAQALAERLSRLEGMAAVVLGGSLARGTAREDSDLDLGLYYYPERPFSVAELGEIARELDDRHLPDLVTPMGEWGPWINGGGWLVIGGRHVDFLYRDLDKVIDVVARCAAGRITCDYQIGHPAGFHNHIYAGEIYHCRPFFDRFGVMRALKGLLAEYTPSMRDATIEKYLYEASFSITIAEKPADRGDVHQVAGCLFRAICCLVQVLYALNRRYFVNEKGSIAEVESFAIRPPDFGARTGAILGALGTAPEQLRASLERCRSLVQAVIELRAA